MSLDDTTPAPVAAASHVTPYIPEEAGQEEGNVQGGKAQTVSGAVPPPPPFEHKPAVSVIFLDLLRHPIENLRYRFTMNGCTIQGKTGPTGQMPVQVAPRPGIPVEVAVQNPYGVWEQVVSTTTQSTHQWLTLVSPRLLIPGCTERLPEGAPIFPQHDEPATPLVFNPQAPVPPPAEGAPLKNNPLLCTKAVKGPQGQSVLKLSVDWPQGLLALFAHYNGEVMGAEDWEKAAVGLECEPEVLQAVAKVESGGREAFWRLDEGKGAFIPAILYERHYFSRLTGARYDATRPDISWRVGYQLDKQLGKPHRKLHDGRVDEDDVYGRYAASYLRLVHAYRLDEDAALKSCSWGKFQIMGANYAMCGVRDIRTFIQAMCTSERTQIGLLAEFIRKKPAVWKDPKQRALGKEMTLLEAIRTKDWRAIALNYNGPNYEKYQYHRKLEAAYVQYKKEKQNG